MSEKTTCRTPKEVARGILYGLMEETSQDAEDANLIGTAQAIHRDRLALLDEIGALAARLSGSPNAPSEYAYRDAISKLRDDLQKGTKE